MSNIFKFSPLKLALIEVLSGVQIESKHFPHGYSEKSYSTPTSFFQGYP